VLISVAGTAWAADDDDAAALSLADKTEVKPEQATDWHAFVEGAVGEASRQGPGLALHNNRLSLDVRYDATIAPSLRGVFADRLDMFRGDETLPGVSGNQDVNTLKEAYLSWQAAPDRIADLGRINVRNGVASGYNPTDFFRAGAVRSVVSLDPASLRENRLGSAMLRGQALWDSGSLTGIYSPKLTDQPSSAPFSPDWGATNQNDRWQLMLSQKVGDTLTPQWLVSGVSGESPQFGFNLNALLTNATVAYMEWAGGRSASLLAQAGIPPVLLPPQLRQGGDSAFRSRLASGLTYTTSSNITLTAEYEYNGAALNQADLAALARSPAAYALYRAFAATVQDPPTRQGLFLYALWQDAGIKNLDLTAFVRHDGEDHSRLQWAEARYHWPHVDVALQAQLNNGTQASDYGALPQRRLLQALLRYYF
jgi:hypothetical protein